MIAEKLLYLKLCLNRSVSHISALKAIVEIFLLMMIYAKLAKTSSTEIIAILAAFSVVFLLIAGHLDLKFGIADKEASLSNRYNPEIRLLVEKQKNARRARKRQ